MGRGTITLRPAVSGDVEGLRELWSDVLRRGSVREQLADLHTLVVASGECTDQRLLVAEHDGRLAGAVHLRASTVSPINLEPVVHAISPHVHPGFRGRGVGAALMEAAVVFAEERGIGLVASASTSTSRDSNRFFARLSMGPKAVLRVAPTHTVRLRLNALRPVRSLSAQSSNRHLDLVLAARRGRRADRVS